MWFVFIATLCIYALLHLLFVWWFVVRFCWLGLFGWWVVICFLCLMFVVVLVRGLWFCVLFVDG